ncbi:hypothetical protein ZYGR_0S02740 [Zygosaccharomyces rouxii]|uniref:Cns1/TTC4 wheel domain-containing protein n=1 Tax=Zygosaccharomyces rouxii TaxID=4956 RepID=A0A1Q3A3G8_ZYGRO|nr:hypothetical protein ZYGR_0S02740 [Zygosaccharomyces rouxii]
MGSGIKDPKRYKPGPNDPVLPPQLSEFQDKNADEILEELNRQPFFMTQLDETDGDKGANLELEALKALAYDGEPHEVAENFKNQANDLYKAKRFKEAREVYKKGIEIKCNDDKVNESLFANLAACELEIKNFRRCINLCQKALQFNPKNMKCYYRIAKAFYQLNKLDEAKESVKFGLTIDSENKSLQTLEGVIDRKQQELHEAKVKRLEEKQKKENLQFIFNGALRMRNIDNVATEKPSELVQEAGISLEDPLDPQSQLIFPAIIMYPTTDEFDFVAQVGELTTVQELIELIMQRPPEWFQIPGHENFQVKSLLGFMETQSGGLVKVGKKVAFHDILKKQTPHIPMFDHAIKIYLVPKSESEQWVSQWDKTKALQRRQK